MLPALTRDSLAYEQPIVRREKAMPGPRCDSMRWKADKTTLSKAGTRSSWTSLERVAEGRGGQHWPFVCAAVVSWHGGRDHRVCEAIGAMG